LLTPLWRLVLVVLLGALAWENARVYPGLSVLLGLGAGLIAVGYLRSGTVWLSWQAVTRGDWDLARRLLAQVPSARWLSKDNRAYHRFIEGGLAAQDGDLDHASQALCDALELGLRTKKAEATAYAMLASVEAARGGVEAARAALAAGELRAESAQTRALLAAVRGQLEGEE